MKRFFIHFFALNWLAILAGQFAYAAEIIHQEPIAFLDEFLPDCSQQVLWLDKNAKTEIEHLLDRPYRGMRVRYCEKGDKTAWVLDEIGKTEPITSGVLVNQGTVEAVRVLVFRESRGGEVHRDVFTRQYDGVELKEDHRLDRRIDGITGATLSVQALNRQTRLALLFDDMVQAKRR